MPAPYRKDLLDKLGLTSWEQLEQRARKKLEAQKKRRRERLAAASRGSQAQRFAPPRKASRKMVDYDEREPRPRKRIKIVVSALLLSSSSNEEATRPARKTRLWLIYPALLPAPYRTTPQRTDASENDDDSEVLSDGDGEPNDDSEEEMSVSSKEDAEDVAFVVRSESENPDDEYESDGDIISISSDSSGNSNTGQPPRDVSEAIGELGDLDITMDEGW
ncbi:hypothetical protein NM208_g9693 [Fusarium decemcellulare]|uniref:Uncharacterized protein n=1 Tax=Fusarium decemcellulare TaxID=57161 RepID=A0ACC1S0L8_9HYPO|nr:hypothetical protein NM208_g9693 [Fusarium decemcellulare]